MAGEGGREGEGKEGIRRGEGKGRGGEALGPAPLHIISGYALKFHICTFFLYLVLILLINDEFANLCE